MYQINMLTPKQSIVAKLHVIILSIGMITKCDFKVSWNDRIKLGSLIGNKT